MRPVLRRRNSGSYLFSLLLALLAAGLLYTCMLLLTDTRRPQPRPLVEGAIRLAQPDPDRLESDPKQREQDRPEPPEKIIKAFSSPKETQTPKPELDLTPLPYSVDIHPTITGGVALPGGPASFGFELSEVDEVPQVLRSIAPEYPYNAKRNHIEGQVMIRMLVTKEGVPTEISIQSSDPPGIFDQASLNAAQRWRFKPGCYMGKAVDTWVLLPFNFELMQ